MWEVPGAVEETKYWVAFSRIPAVGAVRFRRLLDAFGSLEAAWRATLADLKAAGLDQRALSSVSQIRPRLDPDAEMARLDSQDVRALTWEDPAYPTLLKEIYDAPPVLYVKGALLPEDGRAVAVVGTRGATSYGREACAALVRDLALSGVTIVSGLARGIDGIAHRVALEVRGRTIAVMGSGLDIVYPSEHRGLAAEIPKSGALVSEYPLGVRPTSQSFPRRNRILSGLALGVLVVEAPETSGAMWTVRHALDQGREVFGVPGSIFSPASQGVNRLVQDGAKLVLRHTDVLEELNLSALEFGAVLQPEMPGLEEQPVADEEQDPLLSFIGQEPIHIDEVCRSAGLPIASVSSTMVILELQGLVKQVGAMYYVRTRELPAPYLSAT